jgi:hypothetical protein
VSVPESDLHADAGSDSNANYQTFTSPQGGGARRIEIGYIRGRPRSLLKNALWADVEWHYDGSRLTSFRVHRTWPDTGHLCAPQWGPTHWVRGGGVGYSSVDVVVRGSFDCGPVYKVGTITVWRQTVIRLYASGTFQTFWEQ